jgi:hypothetical protein
MPCTSIGCRSKSPIPAAMSPTAQQLRHRLAIRPVPHVTDVDVVIGSKGPIAPPTLCNGLTVPIVAFDEVYSFDIDALIRSTAPRAFRKSRSCASTSPTSFRFWSRRSRPTTITERRAQHASAGKDNGTELIVPHAGVQRGGIARHVRPRIPRPVERMAASTSIAAGCMRSGVRVKLRPMPIVLGAAHPGRKSSVPSTLPPSRAGLQTRLRLSLNAAADQEWDF